MISTAERKWACQDRDKLRQRKGEIRGQPDISESNAEGKGSANRMVENKSDGQRDTQTGKKKKRETKEVCLGCQPEGSASGRYGNQQGHEKRAWSTSPN